MIEGMVNLNCEATVRLILHRVTGEQQEVTAFIDTGFTGHLTLPAAMIERLHLARRGHGRAMLADGGFHVFDVYAGTVLWNRQYRKVEVFEADTEPLVGMGLLKGHHLEMDVVENGTVRIESLD